VELEPSSVTPLEPDTLGLGLIGGR
jgi:hypothetical protein